MCTYFQLIFIPSFVIKKMLGTSYIIHVKLCDLLFVCCMHKNCSCMNCYYKRCVVIVVYFFWYIRAREEFNHIQKEEYSLAALIDKSQHHDLCELKCNQEIQRFYLHGRHRDFFQMWLIAKIMNKQNICFAEYWWGATEELRKNC